MAEFDAVALPADWYADPLGRAVQRYWNGASWTPYVKDEQGNQRVEESPSGGAAPSVAAGERSIVIQNVVQAPQPQPMFSGFMPANPQAKSVGVAALLTVFFGPLGLVYVSVAGGIVLTVITVLTLGLGAIITWPLAIVWSIVGANNHNQRLVAGMQSPQPIHAAAGTYRPAALPAARAVRHDSAGGA